MIMPSYETSSAFNNISIEHSDFIQNSSQKSRGDFEEYAPHKSDYALALEGSAELGYYYTTLFLGYPPQKQTFIVDTGSSMTVVPCNGKRST